MGPEVSLQLVAPGEPLAAEQPVADEGPLARVPPQVSLEVRRLAVHLAAAGDVTAVDVLLAEVDAGRAQPLRLLTVGAVAGRSARVPPLRSRGRHLRTYAQRYRERYVRLRKEMEFFCEEMVTGINWTFILKHLSYI